jgi:hypothetical protein
MADRRRNDARNYFLDSGEKLYLVTFHFTQGKDSNPLNVEAVLAGESLEDVQSQLETGQISRMEWIKYGHGRGKPTRTGTAYDLQTFLQITTDWDIEPQ